MGPRTAAAARVIGLGVCLMALPAIAASDAPWMPNTLPELIRAIDAGVRDELTPAEHAAFAAGDAEHLARTHPALHGRISAAFARWIARWTTRALGDLDGAERRRLERAERAAGGVDERLRAHFASHGWSFRTPRLVLLPQRLMDDPELPAVRARGLYVRYEARTLFVAFDAGPTLQHTLIHESLHFNTRGPGLGRTLDEGIVEAAATELALAWGLVRREALRDAAAYPVELDAVERILDAMSRRGGLSRDEALTALLGAYLTGDASELHALFGAAAWDDIVAASRTGGNVRRAVKRALAPRPPGVAVAAARGD